MDDKTGLVPTPPAPSGLVNAAHRARCNGSVPEEIVEGYPVSWRPCPICMPEASAEYDAPLSGQQGGASDDVLGSTVSEIADWEASHPLPPHVVGVVSGQQGGAVTAGDNGAWPPMSLLLKQADMPDDAALNIVQIRYPLRDTWVVGWEFSVPSKGSASLSAMAEIVRRARLAEQPAPAQEVVTPSAVERFTQYASELAVEAWGAGVEVPELQRRIREIEHNLLQMFTAEARPYLDRALKAEATSAEQPAPAGTGDADRVEGLRKAAEALVNAISEAIAVRYAISTQIGRARWAEILQGTETLRSALAATATNGAPRDGGRS